MLTDYVKSRGCANTTNVQLKVIINTKVFLATAINDTTTRYNATFSSTGTSIPYAIPQYF